MIVIARFNVLDKAVPALRPMIEAIAPQIALQGPIEIEECNEQGLRREGHEAGDRVWHEDDDQVTGDGEPVVSEHADEDGAVADLAGQDAAGEPVKRHTDNRPAGPVRSQKGRAVKPVKD